MFTKDKIDSMIHFSASFIGGYFGIYALAVRSNNFGSSQTSNLIYIVSSLIGSDLYEFFIRIGAALVYMSAIALTVAIPKKFNINIRILSMIVNTFAVVISAFLPLDMDPILALYPIFFAMAFQWNCYSGANGYNSASIFLTNNLRQFTSSLTEILTGNKSQINKCKFYGATLLSFLSGVAISYTLCSLLSINSIWFAIIPIIGTTCLVKVECSSKCEENSFSAVYNKNIA